MQRKERIDGNSFEEVSFSFTLGFNCLISFRQMAKQLLTVRPFFVAMLSMNTQNGSCLEEYSVACGSV